MKNINEQIWEDFEIILDNLTLEFSDKMSDNLDREHWSRRNNLGMRINWQLRFRMQHQLKENNIN